MTCRELLCSRRDIQINGLEQELQQTESSYEEILVWFHMEDMKKHRPQSQIISDDQ